MVWGGELAEQNLVHFSCKICQFSHQICWKWCQIWCWTSRNHS